MIVISFSFDRLAVSCDKINMMLLVMCLFFFILYKSSSMRKESPTRRETPMHMASSQWAPNRENFEFTDVYAEAARARATPGGATKRTVFPERQPRWTERSHKFESTQPHWTTSKWMDSHNSVNERVYPPEKQSQWRDYVQHNESVQYTPTRSKWKDSGSSEAHGEWVDPYEWQSKNWVERPQRSEVQDARTRASWKDNSYQLIKPPASGMEERILSRFLEKIDIEGEQYPIFVECIFRVTSRFQGRLSTVQVILEQIDFGIDRICKKHPNGEKCDSSCSPVFIHKIDFHGSPQDPRNCDQAVLTVEPVETAASFSMQSSRQFKAGLSVNPFTHQFGIPFEVQVSSSMTRDIPAWQFQALKHHAEATWTWTLNRFGNGKKLKFKTPNLGRRPKLGFDPRNMQLRHKYTSFLGKATWAAVGPPQTRFRIEVVVQVAAMKKCFFIHPVRKVKTLELSVDSMEVLEQRRSDKELDPSRNDRAYRFLGEIYSNTQSFER